MKRIYRKTTVSGPVVEVMVLQPLRQPGMKYLRGKNTGQTTEAQAKINEARREHYMGQLINANFTRQDLCVTLCFARPVGDDEAQKKLQACIKALNAARKKDGLKNLRYVYVMERNGSRRHIHIVMDKMPLETLLEKWTAGRLLLERLDPDADRGPLSRYMGKQNKREVKDPEKTVRRWGHSRGNLIMPDVTYDILKRRPRLHQPKKGYYMVQETTVISDTVGEITYLRMVRNGATDYMWGNTTLDVAAGWQLDSG